MTLLTPAQQRYQAEENAKLRERSGDVVINSQVVSFLYELMRDHLPTGTVEKLVLGAIKGETRYSNGYLAAYAADLATRLGSKPKVKKESPPEKLNQNPGGRRGPR